MTTMSGIWRGVMVAGVLAAGQPAGVATAAPLLAAIDAVQPAPPAPPAPAPAPRPRPDERARREAREMQRREVRAEAQARAEAERGSWVSADDGPIVKMFKGGEGITLDLLNMSGDVVVMGGKGRDGKLTIVRRVRGGGPDAERLLRELVVDVAEHANRVEVRTRVPRQRSPHEFKGRVRTDYEIALPAGTALELKNLQGNVKLSNVGGDVRVEAYAGDVVAEALTKVRMLRSMSGDVMLSRSTIEGDANLQTVSGNVIAQAVKATSLTLGSVSGTVQVKDSTSDRALVRTVSGDIEFAGLARKAGRYELKTHAGNIFVFAPASPGYEFEASTFKGDVHTDVPTQPGVAGGRQVRGSVGDGSAFFDLTTFTGDIKVVKKQ
jgi:DUF4097 and DUF4098 domain-containing protein YvlB